MIRRLALVVAAAALAAAAGSSASASAPPDEPAPEEAAGACRAAAPAASSEPAMPTTADAAASSMAPDGSGAAVPTDGSDGSDGSLVVGTWCVVSIGGDDVAAVGASVEFTADGTVQGFGGVNRFSGPYAATADTIEFGPVAATLMAGPEPAMSAESALLAAFVDVQPYAVDGDRLTLGEESVAIVLQRVAGIDEVAGGDRADDIVTVSGTVTYRERMALPDGAVVVVRVVDVSMGDGSLPVAEATITPTHAVPIPYAIAVSSASFVDDHRYALSATIVVGDDVLFTSAESVDVPAAPADQQADLVLVRAA